MNILGYELAEETELMCKAEQKNNLAKTINVFKGQKGCLF